MINTEEGAPYYAESMITGIRNATPGLGAGYMGYEGYQAYERGDIEGVGTATVGVGGNLLLARAAIRSAASSSPTVGSGSASTEGGGLHRVSQVASTPYRPVGVLGWLENMWRARTLGKMVSKASGGKPVRAVVVQELSGRYVTEIGLGPRVQLNAVTGPRLQGGRAVVLFRRAVTHIAVNLTQAGPPHRPGKAQRIGGGWRSWLVVDSSGQGGGGSL